MKLSSFGKMVAPAVKRRAIALQNDIQAGKFIVFQGPIIDRNGRPRLPTGNKPDTQWLFSMDFFALVLKAVCRKNSFLRLGIGQ